MGILVDCKRFPYTFFSFSSRLSLEINPISFNSYRCIHLLKGYWTNGYIRSQRNYRQNSSRFSIKRSEFYCWRPLQAKKSIEDAIEEVDENIIKKYLKNGGKPTDFLRRMEKLAMMFSHYELNDSIDLSYIIPLLNRFQNELFQKIMKVYEAIIYEEIDARRKVEKALGVVTKVNELIIRAGNEKELFEKICKIIVDEGYAHAWIGIPKKDGNIEAIAGHGSDYFKTIEVRWDGSELGKGPTGTAIREKRTVILKSVFSPGYVWRNDAFRSGFRSSIAIPLIYQKRLFGVLNIYAYEEDAFDKEIIRLLERVASNISYAIFSIRAKEDREKAIEQIERNIEHFAFLVDGIRNPLTAIKGYVEMYVNDGDVKRKIYAQLDKILRLVDNLDEGWFKSKKIRKNIIITGNEDGGKP